MRKRHRSTKSRRTWSRGRNSRRHTTRKTRTTTRKSRTTRRSTRRTTARRTHSTKAKWFSAPKSKPSPFTKSFVTGVKTGQPAFNVINNIAKRTGKSFNTICQSLVKAGVCRGQKVNGQWICWPNFKTPANIASCKQAQCTLWQGFVDWCITSGNVTFRNLNTKVGNQATFMKNLQPLIVRQCTLAGTAKVKPGKSTSATKTYAVPFWSTTYAFPALRNSFSRRYAKAA